MNIGENLCELKLGRGFLDSTPKAQSIKKKLTNRTSPSGKLLFSERHCNTAKRKNQVGRKATD